MAHRSDEAKLKILKRFYTTLDTVDNDIIQITEALVEYFIRTYHDHALPKKLYKFGKYMCLEKHEVREILSTHNSHVEKSTSSIIKTVLSKYGEVYLVHHLNRYFKEKIILL